MRRHLLRQLQPAVDAVAPAVRAAVRVRAVAPAVEAVRPDLLRQVDRLPPVDAELRAVAEQVPALVLLEAAAAVPLEHLQQAELPQVVPDRRQADVAALQRQQHRASSAMGFT